MRNSTPLLCDGCGQLADTAHISRRLQRLAWNTRFRPVHIRALLLGGIAPKLDSDFLYAPQTLFGGEAGTILRAVEISADGKSPEMVLGEFQKLGLMLAHILECPLEDGTSLEQARELLEQHLPAAIVRIRRSLKPKRILLISSDLQQLAEQLHRKDLGCSILPSPAGAFLPTPSPVEADFQAFRAALAGCNAHAI
ncbi:MAG: hypothetical protein WBL63_02050 [Candidatus Acidiferrum sp.]